MTATAAVRENLPHWPRLLSRDLAAAYVGLSVNALEQRIGAPWPAPIRVGRRKLYDRDALDRAVDALTRAEASAPAEKIRRERRHAGGRAAPR